MQDALILGAGPAGLATAYEMARHGGRVTVLERLSQVGGLARTVERDGCRYDIGPHRFYTKNDEVNQLFADVLGDDRVKVARLTRIFHNNRLFNYPLTPLNALLGVGAASSVGIMGSYVASKVKRRISPREPENFEEWVTDQFGSKLFRRFFKTYTEKVWGIPCTQIGAEWASQRIKSLSLGAAVRNALSRGRENNIRSLIDEFEYPRLGAGQLYEKMTALIEALGGAVLTNRSVKRIDRQGTHVLSVLVDSGAGLDEMEARHFMSSAPLTEMLEMMHPPPPDDVLTACRGLRYRDHICVNLKVEGEVFPDNWVYVHSSKVKMARIANYRSFSHQMASGHGVTPLTVEYFCFNGDATWRLSDEGLIGLAAQELEQMLVIRRAQVISGFVVRSEKAYPISEIGYDRHIETIKGWLDRFDNLTPIGRSGMFKYNNQDHAIYTGMLAARTALGLGRYNPWLVNIDSEYIEEARR